MLSCYKFSYIWWKTNLYDIAKLQESYFSYIDTTNKYVIMASIPKMNDDDFHVLTDWFGM